MIVAPVLAQAVEAFLLCPPGLRRQQGGSGVLQAQAQPAVQHGGLGEALLKTFLEIGPDHLVVSFGGATPEPCMPLEHARLQPSLLVQA